MNEVSPARFWGADGDEPDADRAFAWVLDSIEPGEVLTYGEIAAEAGWPGRARAVGRYLSNSGGCHPWWRVVSASGRLVPGCEAAQAQRLEAEGVPIDRERMRVAR